MLMGGAMLTTSLFQSSSRVTLDTRVKAAVGYVPYFGIDVYPVSGLLSGDFHLTGEYEKPVGFGAMTIDEGVGYGEPFQRAAS